MITIRSVIFYLALDSLKFYYYLSFNIQYIYNSINYVIHTSHVLCRKYPFQDAYHASIVSLLCKTPHKSNVALTDV